MTSSWTFVPLFFSTSIPTYNTDIYTFLLLPIWSVC